MVAELFGSFEEVRQRIRDAAVVDLLSDALAVTKVGKEGYIHGWICVRPPCGKMGDKVTHPDLGDGIIMAKTPDGHFSASFGGKGVTLGDEDKSKEARENVKNGEAAKVAEAKAKNAAAWKPKKPADAVADTDTFKGTDLTVDGGKKAVPERYVDDNFINVSGKMPDEADGTRFTYRTPDGKVAGFAEAHDNAPWSVYSADGKKLKVEQYSSGQRNHMQVAMRLQDAQSTIARKAKAKLGIEDAYSKRDRLLKGWKAQVKPTAKEKKAISAYSDDSEEWNTDLRAGNLNPWEKQNTELMNAAAYRYSTPEPLTLYRGARLQLPANPVGATVTDHGFTSTSLSQGMAAMFINDVYENDDPDAVPALFRISAPAGTHGIVQLPGEIDEAEFTLPTGNSFKITKATPQDGYTLYDAELIQ